MTPSALPASQPRNTSSVLPSGTLHIGFVLFCGILLSAAGFRFVRTQERERVEGDFKWLAGNERKALEVTIQRYEECLYTLRNLFESSEQVDANEFKKTAADLRTRHPGVHHLQWLPRLRHSDRADFEAIARTMIDPAFVIHRGQRVDNDAGKPFAPVEERPEYLPVHYLEPADGNRAAFGFDHFSGPHLVTLTRAIDSGEIAASGRVEFGDPRRKEIGWAFFLPVFKGSSAPRNAEERRERLLGFVEGAFRFDSVVAEQRPKSTELLDLLLFDRTPGETETYLAGFVAGELRMAAPPPLEQFRSRLHREISVHVAGREWLILCRPSGTLLAREGTAYPWAFLVGGLGLTGLLTALLYSAQRRTATVEHLVRERTAELRAAEEQLRNDIEERKQAQERYRAFVEQSTEAIWRFELDRPMPIDLPEEAQVDYFYSHSFLAECNDALAQMYGRERARDLVGIRLADLLPRSDPANLEHLRDYVRSGFRISNSESHELDRNGKPRIFLNNITGIVESGCLVRYWGTQRDITEQRYAEEARRRAEARLTTALAAANLGTWEWDVETDAVTWSETTEKIFGFEPGEFDGKLSTYLSMVHPDNRRAAETRLKQAASEGGSIAGEIRILRRDETVRWVFSRGDVVRNEQGRITRVVGATLDITEQHEAAEEKARIESRLQESQKLESLGILAGGVAHDFNNLLTGILGNASLARMDLPEDSPVQSSLKAIETTSLRAAELCKQMLAYSGKGHFVVQKLDLSTIVEDTAHLVQLSISKNATLKFDLARNLPAMSADATQMRQIIMNLVINASDALADRSGVISITTGLMHADHEYLSETYLSPTLPEGDYVFLEVSDNGCGMSAETLKKIFDPFFTTKFTGRGLGLAAVLGIVRGHDGALKVYSEPGKGTTFRLLLPCAEGQPDEFGPCVSDVPTWRGSGTVLVVDDEETVRLVAARMLRAIGFQVITATDGRDAIEKFRGHRAQIVAVLLDLTMPQMDGNLAFTELRRIQPDLKVILMSGFNEPDAVHRFAGKGLAGFLQKPYTSEALREKLRALFEAPASALV